MKPASFALIFAITSTGTAGGYLWGASRATAESARLAALAAAAKPERGRSSTSPSTLPLPAGMQADSLTDIFNAPGPLDRFQGIFSYIQNLPADRIEEEIQRIRDQMQTGTLDPDRLFAMHLLMTRFGLEKADQAVAWLDGQDMMTRGFGTVTVLASLASKDPKKAAELFNNPDNPILSIPRVGSFAAIGVAREWARTDPAGAMEWAKSLPAETRGGAYTGLITGMLQDDPVKARQTAMELPPGPDRERLLGNIAENMAHKDPAEALRWAGTLEGEEKAEATKKALNGWANKDPEAAAGHLSSLPETDRDNYMGSVAGRWASRNPSEAAAWVTTQPEGEGRKEAMGSVMGVWAETEPMKASSWLVDQEDGPSKDQGIITLANSQLRSDPEAALTWSASISDPTTRSLQLKGNVRQWARRDESAATEWVTSAPGLTPDDRTELMPVPR